MSGREAGKKLPFHPAETSPTRLTLEFQFIEAPPSISFSDERREAKDVYDLADLFL